MPGGNPDAYSKIEKIFSAIAARDFEGGGCVTYVGS